MIRDKTESNLYLEKKNLNRISDKLTAKSDDLDAILAYLDRTNYKYYNLRDSKPSGLFLKTLTREQVLNNLHRYDTLTVYEDFYDADKNLILQGDIEISKEFKISASLSNIRNISNRQAMLSPTHSLQNLDIVRGREPFIRGLTEIIDYIIINNIFDKVIEFTVYDTPVGILQENIIIWEIRNY